MTATITEINHVEYNSEVLNELGTEINLPDVLSIEFKQGLSSDLNNPL